MENLKVGVIVHFVADDDFDERARGKCRTASVLKVWNAEAGHVNLTVPPDLSGGPEILQRLAFVTFLPDPAGTKHFSYHEPRACPREKRC